MQKIILLATALAASTALVHAGERTDKKRIKQLKADISYLASDKLEGRRTGAAGEKLAGDYIADRFKKIGLQPMLNSGTYTQKFTFASGKTVKPTAYVKFNGKSLRLNADYFILPFSANAEVSGNVISDLLESENIWLLPVYEHLQDTANAQFNLAGNLRDRTRKAIKGGATGVVYYNNATDSRAFSQELLDIQLQSSAEVLSIPAVVILHSSYNNYVQDNSEIELNIDQEGKQRNGINIAAMINNGAKKNVILGAHFDHLGYGEDGNSAYKGTAKQIHNGADDNASGTAALLALAEDIKLRGNRNYNYIFVAFGAQELGMQGSRQFTVQNPDAVSHTNYMINMDMLGRLNERKQNLTISGVQTAAQWNNVIRSIVLGIKVKLDSTIVTNSDQAVFYHKNVPALHVTTGMHSDYHKPSDDTDKINYEGENEIIRYLLELTSKLEAMPALTFSESKEATKAKPASK